MKQKILIVIVLILLLDIRKSNASFFNLGAGELVLIFIGGVFFIGLLTAIISLSLYILKKAKRSKHEG